VDLIKDGTKVKERAIDLGECIFTLNESMSWATCITVVALISKIQFKSR